jgi:hypothetical protein
MTNGVDMSRHQAGAFFLCPLILFFALATNAARGGEVVLNEGLEVGMWGGEHISLEVTEGGARVEYDCAHGTIGRRIVPDRKGRFDVPGTYVEESGGPVREGAQPKSYPARYTGRVSGGRMSVTVTRGDTRKVLGKFTLVRGREPSLFKCR